MGIVVTIEDRAREQLEQNCTDARRPHSDESVCILPSCCCTIDFYFRFTSKIAHQTKINEHNDRFRAVVLMNANNTSNLYYIMGCRLPT